MMPRSVLQFVAIFIVAYSTIVMMVKIMGPVLLGTSSSLIGTPGSTGSFSGMYHQNATHYRLNPQQQERLFYDFHSEQIHQLLTTVASPSSPESSSPTTTTISTETISEAQLDWQIVMDDFDLHQLAKQQNSNATTTTPRTGPDTQDDQYQLITSDNLCRVAKAFQTYWDATEEIMENSNNNKPLHVLPHVLWWKFRVMTSNDDTNNNKFQLSTLVLDQWEEQGCTILEIAKYLEHSDTQAIMVTQGRLLDALQNNILINNCCETMERKVFLMPPSDFLEELRVDASNNNNNNNNNRGTFTDRKPYPPSEQRLKEQQLLLMLDTHDWHVEDSNNDEMIASVSVRERFSESLEYNALVLRQPQPRDSININNIYYNHLQDSRFVVSTFLDSNDDNDNNYNDNQNTNLAGELEGYHQRWIWQALYLGAIPVLELPSKKRRQSSSTNNSTKPSSITTTQQQNNDYYAASLVHNLFLEGLPVVWIDSYDHLSVEFLEEEFRSIALDATSYQYERLTQAYWVRRVFRRTATNIHMQGGRKRRQHSGGRI